jgi:hypothetical protein
MALVSARAPSPSTREKASSSGVARAFHELRHALGAGPRPADLGAQLAGEAVERGDLDVGGGPDGDRVGHVRHPAEPPEEHDHHGDVVGMVAPGDEASVDEHEVGIGLLELEARPAIAERHGDRAAEPPVVALVVRRRVPLEEQDRLLLALRPGTLARDVGAHRRSPRRRAPPARASSRAGGGGATS